MKRKRFTEEQIIGVLKEHELGAKTADLCRKHGISETTFYNCKRKFDGIDVPEAKRLKALETENGKLKRLSADAMLDNAALKDYPRAPAHAAPSTHGSGERQCGSHLPRRRD